MLYYPGDNFKGVHDMEIAYIAGLFDGEGTVGVYRVTNGKDDGRIYWAARLSIVGVYRPMIEAVAQHVGTGRFTTQKRQAKRYTPRGEVGLCKQGWHWSVTARGEIRDILTRMLPYLIEKREQAQIVIDFIDGKLEGEDASLKCKAAKRFDFPVEDFEAYRPRENRGNNAGELNASAKLTVKQVRNIRKQLKAGKRQVDLAAKYGITRTTMSKIAHRKIWKDV